MCDGNIFNFKISLDEMFSKQATASAELLPTTNYWKVLNNDTIELKTKVRPQTSLKSRQESVAGLLKWDC